MVGKKSVDGVNENSEYLVGLCEERGIFISNSYFHTSSCIGKGEYKSPDRYRTRSEVKENKGCRCKSYERNVLTTLQY